MTGYTSLARIMGARCDLSMFRRFSALGAQNLLCMQAELIDLELELKQLTEDRSMFEINKTWSKFNIQHTNEDAQLWRMKHLELRQRLENYCTMLTRAA